ncbi:RNA-guided endonuclease TnpB family protein [Weissella cibaria]|uniref:RNA-guided endonuclease TnpB family protein n=1 Tax=Weissella cibaria TaxID=137591 RepID=UPI001196FB13|nr:RNA-guided endonuclease TnpB family protein [Weissella cibaria]MCS8562612.1 transposase [Weissella cibaria]MCS8565964.1 transposase [Weissella cibaria]MCS8577017.1 transposase [Weissella cibaria]TVV37705.1 IS200/IS605 family element transposase accessory protein TnpB [Weissella cibaria]
MKLENLSKIVENIYVRRYRVVATPELIEHHARNMQTQNQLWNFGNKYLEKTYGRKHLNRPYPNNKTQKNYVINDIKAKFIKENYNLDRWNAVIVGLHSQGANEFLTTLMTNFGEYRKTLYRASKMTTHEKLDYVNNVHGNNSQHRSWYRKGSLNYLRGTKSFKTVSLPNNNQVEIVSAHHIKIQDYGDLQVVENVSNLRNSTIVITKLKRKNNGQFELQLVFKRQVARIEPTTKVAGDWNMTNNKVFHTSNDEEIYISNDVIVKAEVLERQINGLKSKRDKSVWLGKNSRRVAQMNDEIRRLNIKRENILDEHYKQLAHVLMNDYDVIVIEDLDAKDMRTKKRQARSANRKLAMIKPYRMAQFIEMLANRTGKTLIKVDAYKTSQVEYGTTHEEKHDTSVRKWVSTLTGKLINRDLNASWNILYWGLNPEHHIKLKDYPRLSASSLVTIN